MLSNKVSEIMTTGVVTSPTSSTVHEVVELMAARKIGAVVITEGQAAAGIFTEHDIVRRVMNKKRDPKKTGIKKVMTSPVRDVSRETHIIEALGKMYRGKFRHLLIRGEKGAMVGLVSMRDILKLAVELGHGLTDTQTVGTIMSKSVAIVDAGDSIEQAVEKMVEKKTGCVVVLSGGKPVGILTERDVLKWVAAGDITTEKSRVRDLMTTPLVSTGSSAPLSEVLAEMHGRGFRNMPVMGNAGELAGIVSMGDVLKYARGLNVDESVRLAWKEVEEFWDSDEHYTPG
jgi:CBS domain-containing protein